jgi:hypothetical protein
MSDFSEYTLERKMVSPSKMLLINLVNWFFCAKLQLGCLVIIATLALPILWLITQAIMFPIFLPLIILVLWPLSIFFYNRKECSWLIWALLYCLTATAASAVAAYLWGEEKMFALIPFVAIQSFGVGLFMYIDLYNIDSMIIKKKVVE